MFVLGDLKNGLVIEGNTSITPRLTCLRWKSIKVYKFAEAHQAARRA